FWRPEQVAVGTTRWVVEDPQADTVAITQQLNLTYLASQMSFRESPYMHLRAYERGYVKEGVGAGGCAIAAHLYEGWTQSQLRHAVEAQLRQTAFVSGEAAENLS
ncbi:MAG: TIGR00303 family protein, partial [Cyanobacteria bacterium J06649_4]